MHTSVHMQGSHVKLHSIDLCQSSRLQNTLIGMCLCVCRGGRVVLATCSMKLKKLYCTRPWGKDRLLGKLCTVGEGECPLASIAHVSTVQQSHIPVTYILLTRGEAELRRMMALMSSVTSESIPRPRFQGFTIQTLVSPLQDRTTEQWNHNYASFSM